MVKSIALIFLGVLFASLVFSTIAANNDPEKNAVEANEATTEKELERYQGGGYQGGGYQGGGGGYQGGGGGYQGGRCKWGKCCRHGYCHCCYNAQEALAYKQNENNAVEANQETNEKELDGYKGGGGGGHGCKSGKCCHKGYCHCCYNAQEALAYKQDEKNAVEANQATNEKELDGYKGGGGGGHGCKSGKCCHKGYCHCCYNAQEALAYKQDGMLD